VKIRTRAAGSRTRTTGPSEVRLALDAFRRIVQALRANARNDRASLSSAQLFALRQIGEHPGASVNELAALTFTHQSSVSVVVQRLVRRRFVAKASAGDDRRRQCLTLTAAGRDVLRRAPGAIQERLIAAISALPVADRRALANSLGKVAQSVMPRPATTHPPMFFEERVKSDGRNISSGRSKRIARVPKTRMP